MDLWYKQLRFLKSRKIILLHCALKSDVSCGYGLIVFLSFPNSLRKCTPACFTSYPLNRLFGWLFLSCLLSCFILNYFQGLNLLSFYEPYIFTLPSLLAFMWDLGKRQVVLVNNMDAEAWLNGFKSGSMPINCEILGNLKNHLYLSFLMRNGGYHSIHLIWLLCKDYI